jgi:3-phosphoshikimate 1-carboxyvinyltransferase
LPSGTSALARSEWAAPVAEAPVHGRVSVPGSKSMTNRALVLAAIADGPSHIQRPLDSRDTALMATALGALGATVTRDGADLRVQPGARPAGDVAVDVGNAGTVARFVPAVAALGSATVRFDGDPRIRERPVGALIDALRSLGADIDDGGRAALPFTVRGRGGLDGGEVSVDASGSSQLVSGLLLAAPRFRRGVTVRHVGTPIPSQPHLDMTVGMLRAAGVPVDAASETWHVEPSSLPGRTWVVEPDLSSAAPFLAAAMVTGGTIVVTDWPASTTQPGAMLPDLFAEFGGAARRLPAGLELTGPERLTGADLDLHACGELTPVIAAVAALASTPSRLRGIAHLRRHETDRLGALARELTNLGGDARETDDGLEITPRPLHGATFATYDDHRLAMAAAVIGLVVPDVVLDDVATTAKTLPDFTIRWQQMLEAAI